MPSEHDEVSGLLGAWAFDAALPEDAARVRAHLGRCGACTAEAAMLRKAVEALDGGPSSRAARVPPGPAGAGRGDAGVATGGRVLPAPVRTAALRSRPAAFRVAGHAAPYAAAVSGLDALLREVGARGAWSRPVVHDWDVHGTLAHLIAADEALALPLGLAARVPGQWLPASAGWRTVWQARTNEVIARTHAHAPGRTRALWQAQSHTLLESAEARDPVAAARPIPLMGLRLPVSDHFLIRGFETWIHTVDIASALDIRVPPPLERHLTPLVHLAARILRLAVGGRTPPVLLRVGTGASDQWVLGGPQAAPPTAELALDPVDFCFLIGGRYTPEEVPHRMTGEAAPARAVLRRAAELAWL